MIDKAIGGHVTFGDTPQYTVTVETLQELQVPSIVLNNSDEFKKTNKLLKEFISNIAIIQFIDTKIFNLKNIFKAEGLITIAKKVDLYFGIYGGSIRPADKEASGVMYYTLDNLLKEIEETPELFTDDLMTFLTEYEVEIKKFLNQLD